MKMKRRNVFIGALSALTLAAVSVAAFEFNDVEADAATVEYATDSTKWQTTTGMTVDSTYGLVPNVLSTNADAMSATTVNFSADSNGTITSTLSNTTAQYYGVMAYYLKWNEGTDSVTWTWSGSATAMTAGANEFLTHNSGTEKISATNVKGDWIAVIISWAKAPMVLECNNGTITQICDLWADGFGMPDYTTFFNQETRVSYSIADTATGVSYSMKYYAPNNGIQTEVGMTCTGGVQNSTNANLKGEGAVRIEKIIADAAFTAGNANYAAGTGAPSSYIKVAIDASGAGGSTSGENWQVLTNVTEDTTTGELTPTAPANTQFRAVSNPLSNSTTAAEITTTFSEGGGIWGVMIYYLKWNEGVDSVDWSWGDSYDYPIEGAANGLKAANVKGDWIALVVSNMSAPLVIECQNGTLLPYVDNRIWANGFGDADYGLLFNQTTKVKLILTETATGVSLTAKYDAVGVGVDEIGLHMADGSGDTYTSTNANLKGTGSIAITRVLGNAAFSGASKIRVVTEAEKLGTPTVTVTETGIATWQAVTGASGYEYKIGEDGEVTTVPGSYVQMKNGQTLYVRAIGDNINYSTGDWSEAVSFTAKALKTPEVTLSGNVANWTAVAGASGYAYKINDGEEQTTTATSVELLHGQTITVMTKGDNETGFDSETWSTPVTFTATVLSTPTLTCNYENGIVAWDAVAGALKYEYKFGEAGAVEETENTYVDVDESPVTVYVRAAGDQKVYASSDWVSIAYNAPKLDTPAVQFNGNEAVWALQDDAIGYVCKINGVEKSIITDNYVALQNGDRIQVKAIGNGSNRSDSDYSEEVTYQALQLDVPYVEMEGNMAVWEAVDGANGYKYKVNGGEETFTTETSVTLTHGQTIQVMALGDGEKTLNSDYSAEETYYAPQLATPEVQLDTNGARWEAVTGAAKYVYKIDGGAETETTELSVKLEDGQTFIVKAVGNGINTSDSDYSEEKTYVAGALLAPEIILIDNVASWIKDENAVEYVYKINGGAEQKVENGTSVTLKHGDTIQVKAKGDGENSKDSDWSTSKTYKAPKLATPNVTLSGNVASWEAVAGATKYAYKVEIDGEVKEVETTSVVLTHGQTLYVRALGNGETSLDSDWSQEKAYVAERLATPEVTFEGNAAVWEAVDGAVGYAYVINGGEEQNTNGLSVILKNGDTIQVKALGDNQDTCDSEFSEKKTYTAAKLSVPMVTLSGNEATWEAVAGAVEYAYKINNGQTQKTTKTSVALKHGENIVVKAIANGIDNLDSDYSAAKSYNATKLNAPTVSLNDALATWEAVDGAVAYQYKIGENGTATRVEELSVGLISGQTVYVKALGDNETTLDSDWSAAVTYVQANEEEEGAPEGGVPTDEPTYTVEEVSSMIAALPNGLEGKELYQKKGNYAKVNAYYLSAKDAFYSLSEEEQASIENGKQKLDALKTELDTFKARVDKAETVDLMIFAIPMSPITKDNYEARKAQIEKAKAAYDALTAEEKEYCQKQNYLSDRLSQLAAYNGKEGGCGSSIGGGLALVGLAIGACALLKRKKDEE